ncbi:MAG: hypothetical protein COX19_07665 [Desulfobacterales bacterium CG23_combo_of_CG06-09_8_20_14_all_51_8]|nr:MAG: hypothetical protein COX19_07665 [Desulfobacterales bacterium CG23_combo_of_CG06-09_8_20_14_all_51_8]
MIQRFFNFYPPTVLINLALLKNIKLVKPERRNTPTGAGESTRNRCPIFKIQNASFALPGLRFQGKQVPTAHMSNKGSVQLLSLSIQPISIRLSPGNKKTGSTITVNPAFHRIFIKQTAFTWGSISVNAA